MRSVAIITIIIFGLVLVILSLILGIFKNLQNNDLLIYFIKCFKQLATHSIIFFLFATFLLLLFSFGALDFIEIDWKLIIAGIFLFGLVWVIFNICVIGLSILVVHKWYTLENDCKNFSTYYLLTF